MLEFISGQLQQLRDDLSRQFIGYPHGCCTYTAAEVEKRFGLPMLYGLFVRNGVGNSHCWNYDPESGRYVDLTASQFENELPEVFSLPKESPEAQELYCEGVAVSY